MNAKKAKLLRRLSREIGAQAPIVSKATLCNGQVINSPYSQRGTYKQLKKES